MRKLYLLFLLGQLLTHLSDQDFLSCLFAGLFVLFSLFFSWLFGRLLFNFLLLVLLLILELLLVKRYWLAVVIQGHQGGVEHFIAQHVEVLPFRQGEDNVFRFEIGVNDAADPVKVVQAHECLLRYLADHWHWDASIVMLLDHSKQVFAEYLQRHDRVPPIRTHMEELVEHLEVVGMSPCDFEVRVAKVLADRGLPLGVLVVIRDIVQNFLFFKCAFCILICTLLDLESI